MIPRLRCFDVPIEFGMSLGAVIQIRSCIDLFVLPDDRRMAWCADWVLGMTVKPSELDAFPDIGDVPCLFS